MPVAREQPQPAGRCLDGEAAASTIVCEEPTRWSKGRRCLLLSFVVAFNILGKEIGENNIGSAYIAVYVIACRLAGTRTLTAGVGKP